MKAAIDKKGYIDMGFILILVTEEKIKEPLFIDMQMKTAETIPHLEIVNYLRNDILKCVVNNKIYL